jgi:hypothetical protein
VAHGADRTSTHPVPGCGSWLNEPGRYVGSQFRPRAGCGRVYWIKVDNHRSPFCNETNVATLTRVTSCRFCSEHTVYLVDRFCCTHAQDVLIVTKYVCHEVRALLRWIFVRSSCGQQFELVAVGDWSLGRLILRNCHSQWLLGGHLPPFCPPTSSMCTALQGPRGRRTCYFCLTD